jgi:lysophospholipid hydrolase
LDRGDCHQVTQYGTMDFGKHDEIMDVGYQACKRILEDWAKEGKLPSGTVNDAPSKLLLQKRGKSIR